MAALKNEKPLRPAEYAELMQVDRQTVYRWVAEKKIPAHKIGGCIYIFQSEVMGDAGEQENESQD